MIDSLPTTADAKPRLRLPLAALQAPRVTCASRHAAITRELTSYPKYKRWAESQRQGWPSEEGGL
jgi:hypothetical protein